VLCSALVLCPLAPAPNDLPRPSPFRLSADASSCQRTRALKERNYRHLEAPMKQHSYVAQFFALGSLRILGDVGHRSAWHVRGRTFRRTVLFDHVCQQVVASQHFRNEMIPHRKFFSRLHQAEFLSIHQYIKGDENWMNANCAGKEHVE